MIALRAPVTEQLGQISFIYRLGLFKATCSSVSVFSVATTNDANISGHAHGRNSRDDTAYPMMLLPFGPQLTGRDSEIRTFMLPPLAVYSGGSRWHINSWACIRDL